MAVKHVEIFPEIVKKRPSHTRLLIKATKFIFPILVFVSILLGAAGFIALGQYNIVKADVSSLSGQINKLEEALEKQNINEIKEQNRLLREEIKKTQSNLSHYHFASRIPVASGYYKDSQHLLKAGLIATEVGDLAIEAIIPFGDVLGLEGHETNIKAEQKAQIIVRQVIPKLIPQVDQIGEKVKEIKTEVDQVDPNRYPAGFEIRGIRVRELLEDTKRNLGTVEALLPEIKPILSIIPWLAGDPKERNYLILFQNDKELRPTGGFITSYALAKIQGGRLVNIFSEDIYKLDFRYWKKDPPPDYLRRYMNQIEWGLRDSNMFPDYKVSAEKFEEFYKRTPNPRQIDGIIAIDTEFVRRLLEITGPVKSKELNETFSAKNNSLGIPDVVYKLELYSERVTTRKNDRKGFIGGLMNEVINKVSVFPPEKFEPFLTTLYEATIDKHLLFYFKNSDAQALAEKYNFAARIKDFDADYLHVNNSNFGGLKANLYIQHRVDQDIKIANDGTVTKTVTVTLTNPAKADGWLNSIYLNWQRIFVPKGSKLISQTVPRDFTQGVELGKQVFRSYSATLPLKFSTATYTYQLPFKLQKGEKYRLLMQKQPGVEVVVGTIRINGELKKEFKLTKDEEFEFQLD